MIVGNRGNLVFDDTFGFVRFAFRLRGDGVLFWTVSAHCLYLFGVIETTGSHHYKAAHFHSRLLNLSKSPRALLLFLD